MSENSIDVVFSKTFICTALGVIFFFFATLFYLSDRSIVDSTGIAVVDFGVVEPNQVTCRVFDYTNLSDEPLKLTHSRTSCSCLQIIESPEIIGPQSTGSFKFSLNSNGRRGPVQVKAIFWNVDQPERAIRVESKAIVRAVWAYPDSVELGISAGEKGSQDFKLLNAGGESLRVVGVTSVANWIAVRQLSTNQIGKGREEGIAVLGEYQVVIDAKTLRTGRHQAEVSFKIAGVSRDEVVIPIAVEIDGEIRATPTAITFGEIGNGRVHRRVRLKMTSGKKSFDRLVAESDHEYVVATIEEGSSKDGKAWLDVYSRRPSEISGSFFTGSIRVKDAGNECRGEIGYNGTFLSK